MAAGGGSLGLRVHGFEVHVWRAAGVRPGITKQLDLRE